MINPIKQNFIVSSSNIQNKESKAAKEATEAQRLDTKAANIKAAIKNGDYKLDMSATAKAIADSLL